MRFQFSILKLLCLMLLVGLTVKLAWALIGTHARPSIGHHLRVMVDEYPRNHKPLETWIDSHPYLICREGWIAVSEDGNLELLFIANQNVLGQPPLPDLESKCRELGYEIRERKFEYFNPHEQVNFNHGNVGQ